MPLRSADVPAIHTHPWHDTRHHVGRNGTPMPGARFRNVWSSQGEGDPQPSFWKAARWGLGHLLGTKEQTPAPVAALEARRLAPPPARLRVTWLGHATLLLQLPGLTILTDPIFSERCSPLSFAGPKREAPLPLDPAALPPVDVVLLSHDHYDHLDAPSLDALQQRHRPLFVTPLGTEPLPAGARRAALDWHQWLDLEVEVPGGNPGTYRLHCTPARHFSGRGLVRNTSLWASYYLEPLDLGGAPRLYHAADTAYAPHFTRIRERHGAPEVVLMPIGAYDPRWFMRAVHVDPDEAAQAVRDLAGDGPPPHVVPMHWGTFDLAGEPLDEPPRRFRAAAARLGLLADRLHVLPVGGLVEF